MCVFVFIIISKQAKTLINKSVVKQFVLFIAYYNTACACTTLLCHLVATQNKQIK